MPRGDTMVVGPPTHVPIDVLLPGDSPRLAGEDPGHALLLAGMEVRLPPIIVHRPTMRVIDGMHRLRAAVIRGADTIEARFFDGDAELAFLLGVRENITHGLPLSPADREAAAIRVIRIHPEWSDRAIAKASGLSAKTVAAIRRRIGGEGERLRARVGRDGRVRPLDGGEGRLRASQIIEAKPEVSLREVARRAGISVATARDVRERIRQGEDPLPPRQRAATLPKASAVTAIRHESANWPEVRDKLWKDPALKYAESGRRLLRWLDSHAIGTGECEVALRAVPAHWTGELAGLSRMFAQRWMDLAKALEAEAHQRG
ncbi:ParB N-terminal domain-containing protein [Spongiactinospora sp. TRM90649]|uniref:ParB/RepB/Spo0J family partition protein n=1 Tax=Spongiactinospora sp. TRM90649 TaxID=3031114 RepID=UPI0023F84C34|nr:ParB N-terminal domain-containing protein [Spongiactinospora sp. TRM90649]MDF5753665.1 ParB N-terminal domain-containing protein [Spongiactinospora sp. TRM90649]